MDSIGRRLADAKLGAALDDAVQQLPEGYQVDVWIDNRGILVNLWSDEDGKVFYPTGNHSEYLRWPVADQIREAVAFAREREAVNDGD